MTTHLTQELLSSEYPGERPLSERVRAFLVMRGLLSGQLRVSESEGAIVLEGIVGLYRERQLALSCARHVAGVRRVVDRMIVEPRKPLTSDIQEA